MATPIRNFRCPDWLWEQLSNVAHERRTTVSSLITEGIHYVLSQNGNVSTVDTDIVPTVSTLGNTKLGTVGTNFKNAFELILGRLSYLENQINQKDEILRLERELTLFKKGLTTFELATRLGVSEKKLKDTIAEGDYPEAAGVDPDDFSWNMETDGRFYPSINENE